MRELAFLCAAVLLAACDRDGGAKTEFSGERAMEYIRTQLQFGPRIPGSLGHQRTGDWIVDQMRQRADTVIVQSWSHVTQAGDTLPLRNILARHNPAASERILYLAHWDTRPVADQAPQPSRRQLPVPGANDGGSGVALLMALADVLKAAPPEIGVDLLFVDGEDYGEFDRAKRHDVLIGSTYFAAHLPSPDYRPLYGVLWDMIGDGDLQLYQEGYSVERAPEVVSLVWETARRLGYSRYFIPQVGQAVADDHLPLLDAGLRVIDVIDIQYPAHHTPDDLIDKVSARSLQVVGDVAVSLIRR
ncbi:MAG TPA: M28 family peptidase [Gemmatimonadaceae bacterium]|nr:M28 family peptidase [Gemmatimonadaceae bacterium]